MTKEQIDKAVDGATVFAAVPPPATIVWHHDYAFPATWPPRVAIVGSRWFPKLDMVRRFVRQLPPGTTVVSGGADGVDEVAAEEARACGLEVKLFLPQYDVFGKEATFKRNDEIVSDADCVVAFWDGRSRGTAYTFTEAERAQKLRAVIRPPAEA